MEIAPDMIKLVVADRRDVADGITEFTLKPMAEISLPSFDPGSHVAIRTPSGAMRQYSLVNDGDAPSAYVIAIKKEIASRGGSKSMHDDAVPGSVLEAMPPENSFALKDARDYLLIAGGIGITPIMAMADHLEMSGKKFKLIYCARNAQSAAYLDELRAKFADRLTVHFDNGDPQNAYDFWDHFADVSNRHIYCCGPKPLMDEIRNISGHWPDGRINFEDFKPVEAIRVDDKPFDVMLAKAGGTIHIRADQTILEALREAGLEARSSCESGTCGTCKCGLVSGEPEHRDLVLMPEEKDSQIMLCVSRAKSGTLVLDL